MSSTSAARDLVPALRTPDPRPALDLIAQRRSIGRLVEPAPTDDELATMLEAACKAPDHGRLRPWRFVVLRGTARDDLGAAFARAQAERDPDAEEQELTKLAAKALRAPVIVAVVARIVAHPKVREWEQVVAAGCATQNLCLAATAHGYGTMWRTGWLAEHPEVRSHLDLDDRERVVGFVYLGTTPPDHRVPPRELDTACVTWRG